MVIKPGTHSKHVRVEAAQITGFQTFMTGELFDLLARHSVLRHSLAEPGDNDTAGRELDSQAIHQAVLAAQALPLSAALFHVRTRQLLRGDSLASNRDYLSGLLVASELASLASSPWQEIPLILCAAAAHHGVYRAVAEHLGLSERMTVVEPQEVDQLSARGQALVLERNPSGTARTG